MEHLTFLSKQNNLLKKVFNETSSFNDVINFVNNNKLMSFTNFNYEEMYNQVKTYHHVLNRIISIVYKPKISITPHEEIIRSELASLIDPTSLNETLKDSRLWKRKNNKMTPEYVKIQKYEDSVVTYENNFIAMLIDILESKLNERLNDITPFSKSFEELYGVSELNFGKYSFLKEFDMFNNPSVNVFKNKVANTQELIKLINNGLKKIKNIKASELYRFNKNKMKHKNVIPTNILLHESNYAYAYRFYLDNFLKEGEEYTHNLEVSYLNYVLINIFKVINDYVIDKDNLKLFLTSDGVINFKNIKLKINHFTLNISPLDESFTYLIKVQLNQEISLYRLKITYRLNKDNISVLDNDPNYISTLLVTHTNSVSLFDRVNNISIYSRNNLKKIKSMFSSFMLLTLDNENIYESTCPICGKRTLINEDGNKVCESCRSIYVRTKIEKENYIWIKSLRRKKL